MAPTRWGIVSTGKIAFDFTNALSLLPAENHKVAAVAARALPRAQQFAKDFNIPKAYGSYKELSEDPDIDVIYVGTIHPTHFDVCKLMIEAGKNVLCEKPLTMNLKQAKAIIALAKEKKVFFMEGFWSRFFPVYNKLREELEGNTIGDVRFARISFGFNILGIDRISQKELGGGAILDVGCYPVMVAQLLFGEYPEKISATGFFADTGVDEAAFMTLHFSKNRVAQLVGHAGLEMTNTAEIHGDKGIIRIPHFWCPTEINVAGKMHQFPLPTCDKPMFYSNSEGLMYEAEAVRQSLLKGEKENPLMSYDDSLKIIGILDEVRRQIGVVYDADKE